MEGTYIYVFPTEEGKPPRALLANAQMIAEDEEPVGLAVGADVATWSADTGAWMLNGLPVPPELSAAISEHAADLGVPGF